MKPRAETVGEDRGPGEMLRRPNLDSASFLDGTRNDRRVGMWSARALFGIGVCYAMTVVAGFIALGNFRDPLADPYVTIAEVLIIAMAPVMVLLMAAATHARRARNRHNATYSHFMLVCLDYACRRIARWQPHVR